MHNNNRFPPIIAFVGVDGCGKSTIIEWIQKNYRHNTINGFIVINRSNRRREDNQPIQNYSKSIHPYFISVAKLLVNTIRWEFVYWFKLYPLRRKQTLILCDHFYFTGMYLDPRRYRYGGPKHLVAWTLRLIPKPDYYILLDAPFEVLYSRKQEAEPQEVQDLINQYRQYLAEIPNGYTIDASLPVDQVGLEVSNILNQIMAAK